jgi:hypothetical protein
MRRFNKYSLGVGAWRSVEKKYFLGTRCLLISDYSKSGSGSR